MKATPVVLFRLVFVLTFVIITSFHFGVDGLVSSLRKRSRERMREERVLLIGERLSHRHELLEQEHRLERVQQHLCPHPVDIFKNIAMRSLDHLKNLFTGEKHSTNLPTNIQIS